MFRSRGRIGAYTVAAFILIIFIYHLKPFRSRSSLLFTPPPQDADQGPFRWSKRKEHYPVQDQHVIPAAAPLFGSIPKIQHDFSESPQQLATNKQRLAEVRAAMERSWSAYRERAWLMDELAPVSGGNKTTYGGWAATLCDSLDTLWIMDMKQEFREAVDAIASIDFTATTMETINLFETTIRYMGGFLSAYDLSGDRRLLDKSIELADMIYAAFDTPNRMPILRWDFHAARDGKEQVSPEKIILAEIGSLCLEFTRLSQITGESKWYDAVARITNTFDEQQFKSALPGMWPFQVNGGAGDFASGDMFSLGAFSDSMYEYLPKMYALLGGSSQYAKMYLAAMETALQYVVFRPMIKDKDVDILASGSARISEAGQIELQPEYQHLVCFTGGMFAMGGRLFNNASHIEIGARLTDGCVWAYQQTQLTIMPENSQLVPCPTLEKCEWSEQAWHDGIVKDSAVFDNMGKNATTLIEEMRLPPGFTTIRDARYHLRPEATESVFMMYRITGDSSWQDKGWKMFETIHTHTKTEFAHAAIEDVTNSTAPKLDNMESFWTAETLKYFYLLFSDPNHISLDDYVFNTEAHPLKRPGKRGWLGFGWG
ncbi:putative glycoside hydrolase family 47, six-hairpin glycosidase-like superfamily [Septoria linicola]|nr:putative glycoside hydrolase family 47, six-hairpin glycosidase-like superfamily [Septoria linicola]